jgi:hypothetical protein
MIAREFLNDVVAVGVPERAPPAERMKPGVATDPGAKA